MYISFVATEVYNMFISFVGQKTYHIFKVTKEKQISLLTSEISSLVKSHKNIRKYHNHKLQKKPWTREEEPHNNHETPGRQTKQRNSSLFPIEMIAKLEWTQSNAQQNITRPRSAVGNVSGNKCESDCRSRGRKFDPGAVPYFRGD